MLFFFNQPVITGLASLIKARPTHLGFGSAKRNLLVI